MKNEYIDTFIRQREKHVLLESAKPIGERDMYPEGTDAQLVVDCLIEVFLGKDWYISDPLCNAQVNTIALDEILYKHSRINASKGLKFGSALLLLLTMAGSMLLFVEMFKQVEGIQ